MSGHFEDRLEIEDLTLIKIKLKLLQTLLNSRLKKLVHSQICDSCLMQTISAEVLVSEQKSWTKLLFLA